MLSRLQWLLLQLSRMVWLRATAFSVLGVVTALIALLVKRYIPADIPTKIGADAVGSLLNIIASSMLSVTIFSLSTMVSAYASATSNATPRATSLLIADSTAQNALGTFVGSFLFSLVGIIVLQSGLYGDSGRVVLYVVTLLVIAFIVFTLLRWIDYVLRLGRVGPTSDRVEEAATTAMRLRRKAPYLGGQPCHTEPDTTPHGAVALHGQRFGCVEHIDMQALQDAADAADLQIRIVSLPGMIVGTTYPLAWITGAPSDDCIAAIRHAFRIASARSFDQDPRFGACVLSEIASRALSPAINDPGTAIDILNRGVRVLALWSDHYAGSPEPAEEVRFPRVQVPPILLDDLFDDFFTPIARDGAGNVEVCIHLQKMLRSLANLGDSRYRKAALRHSIEALKRAEAAMTFSGDIERVRDAAARVADAAGK